MRLDDVLGDRGNRDVDGSKGKHSSDRPMQVNMSD